MVRNGDRCGVTKQIRWLMDGGCHQKRTHMLRQTQIKRKKKTQKGKKHARVIANRASRRYPVRYHRCPGLLWHLAEQSAAWKPGGRHEAKATDRSSQRAWLTAISGMNKCEESKIFPAKPMKSWTFWQEKVFSSKIYQRLNVLPPGKLKKKFSEQNQTG